MKMKLVRMPTAVAIAACLAHSPTMAAPKDIKQSWGKADISYENYVADSAACVKKGYYLDISGTDAVAALLLASHQLDLLDTGPTDPQQAMQRSAQIARVQEGVQPQKRFEEIRKLQQQAIDACLLQLGYTRFSLTREQRKSIRQFPIGSSERRHFLFELASDPAILQRQATPPS